MSNEITSLDIAAQCLVEFPDAPWELRLELARQCWDESRHVEVLHRRLRELGGHKGEFPISTFEWSITCALDTLAGRLATQNRTFEAGAMDVVGSLAPAVRAVGDAETAEVLDGILADEVHHVRFANRWIKAFVEQDRRVLLKVAAAVRFLAEANAALQSQAGEANAVGRAMADPGRARARGQRRGPAPGRVHRRGDPRDPAPGRLPLAHARGSAHLSALDPRFRGARAATRASA